MADSVFVWMDLVPYHHRPANQPRRATIAPRRVSIESEIDYVEPSACHPNRPSVRPDRTTHKPKLQKTQRVRSSRGYVSVCVPRTAPHCCGARCGRRAWDSPQEPPARHPVRNPFRKPGTATIFSPIRPRERQRAERESSCWLCASRSRRLEECRGRARIGVLA